MAAEPLTAAARHQRLRLAAKLAGVACVAAIYVAVMASEGVNQAWEVYASNALVVGWCLYQIFDTEGRAYSARKTFYLFMFFFMGVAPLLQYKQDVATVGGYDIAADTYTAVNLLLVVTMMVWEFFYGVFFRECRFAWLRRKLVDSTSAFAESELWRLGLLAISAVATAAVVWWFRDAPLLLLFRGVLGVDNVADGQGGSYSEMVVNTFVRALPVACCVTYWCLGRKRSYKFLFLALMLLACFPSSLSRLRVAAYYLPLLIIICPWLRYRNRFAYLLSAGLLVAFPLLDNFRKVGARSDVPLDFSMFTEAHFDSYQSLAFVVQNGIITWGHQLLGSVFFFVPRSIWPGKAMHSGVEVANSYNLSFHNISMNYFGEGYINFGIPGVLLFAVALAWLTAMADKLYWHYDDARLRSRLAPFYLFFVGMYFFFMRGDLAYGIQFTLMLMCACWVPYAWSSIRFRRKHPAEP